MDEASIQHTAFLLEMKFCEPKKTTEQGNWFDKDTSSINFKALKADDVFSSDFFKNGEGKEVLTGNYTFDKYNVFDYGNQVFAWEKIIVFRITDTAAVNKMNAMYIVLPVINKSFVTAIVLPDITFQPGKVIWMDKVSSVYNKNRLTISCKDIMACGSYRDNPELLEWIKK
jgi:hypothetical protein